MGRHRNGFPRLGSCGITADFRFIEKIQLLAVNVFNLLAGLPEHTLAQANKLLVQRLQPDKRILLGSIFFFQLLVLCFEGGVFLFKSANVGGNLRGQSAQINLRHILCRLSAAFFTRRLYRRKEQISSKMREIATEKITVKKAVRLVRILREKRKHC